MRARGGAAIPNHYRYSAAAWPGFIATALRFVWGWAAGTQLGSEGWAAVCVGSGPGGDGGVPNRMDEWKTAYTCTLRLGAQHPILLPALSMATASSGLIVPSAT